MFIVITDIFDNLWLYVFCLLSFFFLFSPSLCSGELIMFSLTSYFFLIIWKLWIVLMFIHKF